MTTFNYTESLVVEHCYSCQIAFAMPEGFRQMKLDKRGTDAQAFFCPAGHRQHYVGKTEEQKLKEQLAAKDEELRQAQHARDLEETRANNNLKALKTAKVAATRAKARCAAGVCPCCTRTFKQLAAHMKNKHPEYTA